MDNSIKSTNPARGFEIIGSVELTSSDDIANAVTKARSALCEWKRISVDERCVYLDRFRGLLERNADEVARLQSMEMGKPFQESRQELISAIRFLKNQTNKAAKLLAPRKLDSYQTHLTEARYEPFGVAAVITPWNFPTGQFVANSSQVLLAGNTVVLKHSEECVLTSQLLDSLMQRAALPEGVFQVIYGDGEVGRGNPKASEPVMRSLRSTKRFSCLSKASCSTSYVLVLPVVIGPKGNSTRFISSRPKSGITSVTFFLFF